MSPIVLLNSFTLVVRVVTTAVGAESASLELVVFSPSFIRSNSMGVKVVLYGSLLGDLRNLGSIFVADLNIRMDSVVVSSIEPCQRIVAV